MPPQVSYYPSPYRNRVKPTVRSKVFGPRGKVNTAGVFVEDDEDGPVGKGDGLFCLTFTVRFPQAGRYRLACCYPYTYSDLQRCLHLTMKRSLQLETVVQRSLLCYTLAGHRCDLLTITDFSSPADVVASRECVVITARVHPGETCASWMMQVSCKPAVREVPHTMQLVSIVQMLHTMQLVSIVQYQDNVYGE